MKLSTLLSQSPYKAEPEKGGLSLALKIVTPVVGVIAVTCVFLFTIYSKRLEDQGNTYLRHELESYATSKAAELSEPLWNFQTDLISRLMHSYLDNRNLLAIELYDFKGELVAQENKEDTAAFSTVMVAERLLSRTAGGEEFDLGRLVVKYHDGNIMADLANRRGSDIAFSLVLMVILAGTIWFTVHLLVGRPLKRIQRSLRENTAQNKRTPLSWSSRDELGDVVFAYNGLLQEIEHQTSALMSMNTTLRYEVENRIIAERELAKVHEGLEHEVAMRTLELNLANQELIDLDLQRAAFLSSASHELRTPLAAVLGFATLIKKSFSKFFMPYAEERAINDKGEVILNNLDIISTEGGRLTRLIDDLLDLNKIEAGHMEWRDAELDVTEEVHRAMATMHTAVDNNPGLDLRVSTGAHMPPLTFDPDRFQQILINLLSNAIKHTQAGIIRLTAEEDYGIIRITITDTGSGIPRDDLQFIFHKFYQSGSDHTYKPTGTGLGLPICKNIVEHYGGDISVKSEMGVGTTFIVELPSNRNIPKIY